MLDIQLTASRIVAKVLEDGRNLDQVLEESIQPDWTSQQRGAVRDLSYGCLRYYGQLDALLALLLHKPLSDKKIRYLILVALYQLIYTKAASYAVVDHAVRAAQRLNKRISGLVNACLRNFMRQQDTLLAQAQNTAMGRYNHPQWWIDALFSHYPDQAETVLQAGNSHPPMSLRVNCRQSTVADYFASLTTAARLIEPDAIQLAKALPVDQLPGFAQGRVSVQDAGAQYAANLLDVQPGMTVLDACAAPGGKTAHILELADVNILALDKDAKRLQRVADNLQRLGLHAQLKAADAAQPAQWWDGQPFERILADVPCSASGVARRHPDIKWLRRASDIAFFAEQQWQILSALWPTLALNGKLLYATCSIFPQENELLIQRFLASQPDALRLPLPISQLLPNAEHDGFFYALLQKTAQ